MIGSELKSVRERKKISLRHCAETAGISESALKQIEAGKRYPTLRTLEGLAECLGITVVVTPTETFIDDH